MLLQILTWPWHMARRMFYARPIRFTRFGWFYIAFSLAVGAAAINTGNNLLYLMLGLLLGFIIISGVLSDSCLWGLDIELTALGDFYAGQPGEWDLIASKNWFPGVILQIDAEWPTQTTKHLFYWIPRYGRSTRRVTLTPPQRGRFPIRGLRYSTRFPFGLFEKTHRQRGEQSWVVFPRVETLPLTLLRAAGLSLADQPAERKGPGTVPFDLREFQEGDSSKRIHWKSSAKRGQLMVADMEEESGASRTVIVPHWPTEKIEAFISFVASLVYTLHRQGLGVRLQTSGVLLESDRSKAQLKKILEYLALVDPASEGSKGDLRSIPRGIDAVALWSRYGH